MANSFSLKTIELTITLGKGVFSEGGNTKTIEGLACDATIQKPGLPHKNSARVRVWGLSYEDLAELTMLSFRPLEAQHNIISIKAGEKDKPLSLVFEGEIVSAHADFNQAPDVSMEFTAQSGNYPMKISAPVFTVEGEVPVTDLFSRFAAMSGYSFINEGVTASVKNAWFPGSPVDKMLKLARDINCELIIDDGQVVIMPAGAARRGDAVFLSPETGLIGYPTFNQDGISCRSLFNPALISGGLIKVKSMVPKASGTWRITNLTHHLVAHSPSGGSWESQIEAAYIE